MSEVLQWLGLNPSPQSVDYVGNKTQFHLFNLLTEQRHPNTWNLSFAIQSNIEAGLRMLLSVDRDISQKLKWLVENPEAPEQAVRAVASAAMSGHKIYVYGCGATGRLAKQMESNFWRPFWKMVRRHDSWKKLQPHLPADIENRLIGEMTGADRALVSSLEGFEDLQLIGKLQLEDHGVTRGDVVICVTEGGETSSVIGTVLAALRQYGDPDEALRGEARNHLYFVYNNPDNVLRPFERSSSVLENPAITKINLTTGPQAITGSTRLQATTSETFVVGAILEEALARVLREHLARGELKALGYGAPVSLVERIAAFDRIKSAVDACVPDMARFTELEADTYRRGGFSTYFAKAALITVFIDNTERSPTFRLYPLDRAQDTERRSWVQVWTEAADLKEAWRNFLGRPFKGLRESSYRNAFERGVSDPYLREAALRSLTSAGDDQELSYDFSFSPANVESKGPRPGDLGVLVLLDEELVELDRPDSSFNKFINVCQERGANLAALVVARRNLADAADGLKRRLREGDVLVKAVLEAEDDPLTLRRQIALKMILNAHSTGVMAAVGRVVGNTMTNVSPTNLKLIGRATYLIMTHVNDTLAQRDWVAAHGFADAVTFAEANAVLFDAMEYVRSHEMGQTAEVALSIIRMLEAFQRRAPASWDDARALLESDGLAGYLARHNPRLAT